MFQEQYGQIQEYNMDTAGQTTVGTVITITVYKNDGNDRLDDRVVTANTYTGDVSCVCKYWDTMGLLCRHCLLVMFVQRCNGHVAFRGLQDTTRKRIANSGFLLHLTADRPLLGFLTADTRPLLG
ncbi:hypothetical protein LINPERPRIM_LOCUS8476 [Linum perenne]